MQRVGEQQCAYMGSLEAVEVSNVHSDVLLSLSTRSRSCRIPLTPKKVR